VDNGGRRALSIAPYRSPPLSTALSRRARRLAGLAAQVGFRTRPSLAQALARRIDAIGVVNDAVEDGVGEGWNADQVMPAVSMGPTDSLRAQPPRRLVWSRDRAK
jgi:hypothetical protein